MTALETIPSLVIPWAAAWISGLVVCTSAAVLFWITYNREHKLRAAWRAGGFLGLAISFTLGLLGIWLPQVSFGALILQPFAFFVIYRGVYYEPILTHLRTVATRAERKRATKHKHTAAARQRERLHLVLVLGIATILFAASTISSQVFSMASYLLSTLFIALTIHLQFRRLLWEQDGPSIRLQNFYPLAGYICLLFYTALSTPPNILPAYAVIPPLGLLAGMVFLALWAWIFIHVRNILRRSIMVFGVLTISSSIAVFGLTYFVTRLIRWLAGLTIS